MRSLFFIMLLTSFIGLAVFGFWIVGDIQRNHGNCVAAAMRGSYCPLGSTALFVAGFHLSAFKSFLAGTTGIFSFLVLLSLVGGVNFLGRVSSKILFLVFAVASRLIQLAELRYSVVLRLLLNWFALHENSPAVLMASLG